MHAAGFKRLSKFLCRCSRILALNRMEERNPKINEILSTGFFSRQILSAVAKLENDFVFSLTVLKSPLNKSVPKKKVFEPC